VKNHLSHAIITERAQETQNKQTSGKMKSVS